MGLNDDQVAALTKAAGTDGTSADGTDFVPAEEHTGAVSSPPG